MLSSFIVVAVLSVVRPSKNPPLRKTADLFHHGLAAGIAEVGNRHFGALTRQCGRTRCANPRCAARYDGNFILNLAHNVLRRLWHVLPILCTVVSLLVEPCFARWMLSGRGLHLPTVDARRIMRFGRAHSIRDGGANRMQVVERRRGP